jgi:sugar lactone lactonase YvrE
MRIAIPSADQLGECPTWDDASNCLRWIDIVGKRLCSWSSDSLQIKGCALPETPGSFALRRDAGLLMAYRRRLTLLDATGREVTSFVPPSMDVTRERFNDSICDPQGRCWIGTMDRYLREPVGSLYCIEPNLSSRRAATGFGISNGLAFSPDCERLYHCDSHPPCIYVYDFDLTRGEVSNRRIFKHFSPDEGVPDGCKSDEAGQLWVAVPGTGQIMIFQPDGRLARSIKVPVNWPSSLAFGGVDRRTVFITSLQPDRGSINPNAGLASEHDGAIFSLAVDLPGTRIAPFAG